MNNKTKTQTNKPGFFTGKKPNFASRVLAAPFNAIGNALLIPKNLKERSKDEYIGNTHHGNKRDGETTSETYSDGQGGTITSTPRPPNHYFDLLDGGKKEMHNIQLDRQIDLSYIRPDQAENAKAMLAAKAANDIKIRESARVSPYSKAEYQESIKPPSYRESPVPPAYYSPYK